MLAIWFSNLPYRWPENDSQLDFSLQSRWDREIEPFYCLLVPFEELHSLGGGGEPDPS
jgi:hypothetical protein